jgi:hypothetical protein
MDKKPTIIVGVAILVVFLIAYYLKPIPDVYSNPGGFAPMTSIYMGDYLNGYRVLVSSWGTNTLISAPSSAVNETSGWIITNPVGGYAVWIDSYSGVATGGANEGYVLPADKTLTFSGRCTANIYARTLAGQSGWTTCYILLTGYR